MVRFLDKYHALMKLRFIFCAVKMIILKAQGGILGAMQRVCGKEHLQCKEYGSLHICHKSHVLFP